MTRMGRIKEFDFAPHSRHWRNSRLDPFALWLIFLGCCSRGVVPVASFSLEAFVRDVDPDFSERSIRPPIAGPVGNAVLGPQFLADVLETDREILNLEWEERLAASLFREFPQRFVAAILFLGTKIGGGIRADAVDRNEVLLRHFQCFGQRCSAGVIIAVAD